MTLHALRRTVGDPAFFQILRTWTTSRSGTNVTTSRFTALAERISGRQLGDFFDAWLFGRTEPAVPPGAATVRRADGAPSPSHPKQEQPGERRLTEGAHLR
jgi:aminopeptidase N